MTKRIEDKILRCEGYFRRVYGEDKARKIIEQSLEMYKADADQMPVLKSRSNMAFMELMDYMIFVYKALKEIEGIEKAGEIAEACFNDSLDLDFQPEAIRAAYKNVDGLREKRKMIIQDVNAADEEYGWIYDDFQVEEDTLYSFNVKRCGMLNLCRKFGVPELMPHICQGDFYLMKYFPEGYEFSRKGTLADGSDCCDFYYPKRG